MNLIINDDRIVSLKKHPAGLFAQEMTQLIQPLKEAFGVTYFFYGKLLDCGKDAYLTNLPAFSEDFINHKFYKLGFVSDPKMYQSCFYFLDTFAPNEISALIQERYGVSHLLAIFRQQGTYCEKFLFGTSVDNMDIMNAYLNHLSVFNGFADYFKEQAAHLIAQSDCSPIQYPVLECRETLIKQDFHEKCLNIAFPNGFTSKENECAFYLAQCLRLEEIAMHMSISPRTLEKHIAKLKLKLGCKSLSSLVVALRKHFF